MRKTGIDRLVARRSPASQLIREAYEIDTDARRFEKRGNTALANDTRQLAEDVREAARRKLSMEDEGKR